MKRLWELIKRLWEKFKKPFKGLWIGAKKLYVKTETLSGKTVDTVVDSSLSFLKKLLDNPVKLVLVFLLGVVVLQLAFTGTSGVILFFLELISKLFDMVGLLLQKAQWAIVAVILGVVAFFTVRTVFVNKK